MWRKQLFHTTCILCKVFPVKSAWGHSSSTVYNLPRRIGLSKNEVSNFIRFKVMENWVPKFKKQVTWPWPHHLWDRSSSTVVFSLLSVRMNHFVCFFGSSSRVQTRPYPYLLFMQNKSKDIWCTFLGVLKINLMFTIVPLFRKKSLILGPFGRVRKYSAENRLTIGMLKYSLHCIQVTCAARFLAIKTWQ